MKNIIKKTNKQTNICIVLNKYNFKCKLYLTLICRL